MTVWAPYKGTKNRWQMEHSNDCLDTIQGHNEHNYGRWSTAMTVWTPYKGHKEHMVDGAQQ